MLNFHTTQALFRRASMAWKPIKYSATRRRNAKKRRTQQLMVDVELTKKYTSFIKNKPSAFESPNGLKFDLERNAAIVLQKVREIQPVSLGKSKIVKREIVDQWFQLQGKNAAL